MCKILFFDPWGFDRCARGSNARTGMARLRRPGPRFAPRSRPDTSLPGPRNRSRRRRRPRQAMKYERDRVRFARAHAQARRGSARGGGHPRGLAAPRTNADETTDNRVDP